MIRYETAPNFWGRDWQLYIEHAILPGSFGTALLNNDLRDAVLRADSINIRLIPQHVKWMWENLPYESWGSAGAVQAWIEWGGTLSGKQKLVSNDNG